MRTFILSCALALGSLSTFAQGYQFTDVVKVPATPVKNQASTGTCWCFATTSFMESELLRMGKGTYDLSEMFIVRQKYMNQLQDNYVRQGRGNIGQGSLSHTFMNAFNQVGIVPEEYQLRFRPAQSCRDGKIHQGDRNDRRGYEKTEPGILQTNR